MAPVRVLLAEPKRGDRENLAAALRKAGLEVTATASGLDVLMICEVQPPDVLILNVQLPDMDGFEVVEYVRRETKGMNVTVILATQATDDPGQTNFARKAEFAGADHAVTKPYDAELLVRHIRSSIGLAAVSAPSSDRCRERGDGGSQLSCGREYA